MKEVEDDLEDDFARDPQSSPNFEPLLKKKSIVEEPSPQQKYTPLYKPPLPAPSPAPLRGVVHPP